MRPHSAKRQNVFNRLKYGPYGHAPQDQYVNKNKRVRVKLVSLNGENKSPSHQSARKLIHTFHPGGTIDQPICQKLRTPLNGNS